MSVPFHVIIVAAGFGSRLGTDVPKQYLNLDGKVILRRTIDAFRSLEGLGQLCVVINPDHKPLFDKAVEGLNNISFCYGGDERFISVNNGLNNLSNLLDEDIVLVHDAARPFVRPEDILRIVKTMETQDAASLAVQVVDTLRYQHAHAPVAADFVDRKELWAMQTPQAFKYNILKKAHERAKSGENYTDDTAIVSDMGIDVQLVAGDKTNFKITTREDLKLAESLIAAENQFETCIGQGFDVHAFDEGAGDTVILCGVPIPHHCKLKGHSDADVGLHALTDAILGAIGEGDIGLHFPPSNMDFKDMDSAIFLKKAMELLQNKGGRLINVDVTLICEAPKVGPYREAIIGRIATILGLTENRVNVKATTTEKLGFTGRKEGIAAQAIASVHLPIAREGQ